MIISHKHKFIFIHIPKCAGTSVCRALIDALYNPPSTDYETLDREVVQVFKGTWPTHSNVLLQQHSRRKCIEQYLANIQGQDINDYFTFTFMRNPWERAVSSYFYARKKEINGKWAKNISNMEFSDFLKTAWLNQCWYIRPKIDFIGSGSNLQKEFDIVCDRIGCPPTKLPWWNKTDHKHYTEYYDDESRELVAKKCREEIRLLRYKFGQ